MYWDKSENLLLIKISFYRSELYWLKQSFSFKYSFNLNHHFFTSILFRSEALPKKTLVSSHRAGFICVFYSTSPKKLILFVIFACLFYLLLKESEPNITGTILHFKNFSWWASWKHPQALQGRQEQERFRKGNVELCKRFSQVGWDGTGHRRLPKLGFHEVTAEGAAPQGCCRLCKKREGCRHN